MTHPTAGRKLFRRKATRILIAVGLVVILLVAVTVLVAGPIMDARASTVLACSSGNNNVSVHVDDPIPAIDLATGHVGKATIRLHRDDATIAVALRDIDVKTKRVAHATATVTTPWSTVVKQASNLPAGATLSSEGPRIAVNMASRPGVQLLLRLTHTSTALTIQGTNVKIGDATYPLTGALGNLPALQRLTQKHTLHPTLPTGARIIAATPVDGGLQTRLSLDTAHLGNLTGTETQSQGPCN